MVNKNLNNVLGYSMTILVYILIIAPTAYTLHLCVLRGNSLSTWHIVTFTLACCVFLMEGNLSVSGDAFLVSKVSRPGRVRIHWILHFIGLVMIAAGMITVVVNKNQAGMPHIVSNHAKLGLAGVVLMYFAGLNGVMTLYPKSFLGIIGLGPIKIFHTFIGLAATVLMFAGQITGVNTGWWQGTDLGWWLTIIAYHVGLFLTFVKPTISTGGRIRKLFDNSS